MRALELLPPAARSERAGARGPQAPGAVPLSAAAARLRDRLGVPITALPGVEAERQDALGRRSRALERLIDADAAAFPRLWEPGELGAVEEQGLAGLAREWLRRLDGHPLWSRVAGVFQPERDHAAIWRDILGGDFDLSGRGSEYTEGMAVFQASRWLGARTLLDLLGAGRGGGTFLDVLGGDGYVWRILQAERRLARSPGGGVHTAEEPLIITNDVSPHMFARAGTWGLPTREDAARLSRTFRPGSLDGVLFAYGTHHIADMPSAVGEAHRVLRPGGTVVVHDFFDEGPAGQWFHRVVHERSKTGHPFPHIGPVQMAALLLGAGFQDVRLHEIQDPFLFACEEGEGSARDLALHYVCGMYGLAPGFPNGLDELEGTIREVLTYPETGEVPVFTDDFVYIPRRAVVAVGTRPEGEPVHTEGDLALIGTVRALLERAPEEIAAEAALPADVHPYWFAEDGSRWGITPHERAAWLAWARGRAPGKGTPDREP